MLKSVIFLAAAACAAAQCVCETVREGDPLCAFQYVLVGKALDVKIPDCNAPLRPEGGEIVDFEEFAFEFTNFEVEAVLKQPLLDDSPDVQSGQIIQVYTARTVEACGFPFEAESTYLITAFLEELDGCLEDEDPLARRLNLATTFCSDNIAEPNVFEVLQFASDCGSEFGVETPDEELEQLPDLASGGSAAEALEDIREDIDV